MISSLFCCETFEMRHDVLRSIIPEMPSCLHGTPYQTSDIIADIWNSFFIGSLLSPVFISAIFSPNALQLCWNNTLPFPPQSLGSFSINDRNGNDNGIN